MIKHIIISFCVIFLMACSQKTSPQLRADGLCAAPRPEICTMHYEPVCAEVAGEPKEYGNACSACGDSEVNSYQFGACPE